MKIPLGIIVVVPPAAVVVVFFRGRGKGARDLTADEAKMRDLVREVYGDKITAERLAFSGTDAVLTVALRDEKVASLDVNLSSLARKHRDEGLSAAVIKLSLKF
jgi:hypothetical protein